ncbi:hypothetical protein ACCO45_001454 [Purpureocillium lilacinum]|uniref:Uncharacterized protein n=1 Tax=Purpureocillium lilacinum TaxID=33203 RepID=A0ACC4E731_PURLI
MPPGSDNNKGEDERGRGKLVAPLALPKNRSTGNLALSADGTVDRSRYRMSFEGSSPLTCPIMNTDKDSRAFAASASNTPVAQSYGMLANLTGTVSLPGGPTSPKFSEDLSRFPSESLHSFSFAHKSEDFIHNRQTVLKRSMEFMKDRMGRTVSLNSTQAGIASAQARVTGDIETQNMLELLARAQLIGAGNLPNAESSWATGPLTGPPDMTGENIFDKQFTPSSVAAAEGLSDSVSPTGATAPKSPQVQFAQRKLSVPQGPPATVGEVDRSSEESSRTPTNESGTTTKTSPPASRPTSLKRTMTDTLGITMQDKLIDTMTQPFIAGGPIYEEPATSPVLTHAMLPSKNFPSALGPTVHGHTNRWVPAAQAIFTTEAKPPWTIIAANDLACLVFGVTKAEVRRMGILEVVQEERRAWLERKLLRVDDADDAADGATKGSKTKNPAASAASTLLGSRSGITAQLLSKPNSRAQPPKYSQRRAQTVHSGDPSPQKREEVKRNGATGSASLWVKEKRIGLIWVLEEIHEDVANIELDEEGAVKAVTGAAEPIWGPRSVRPGVDVASLIPRIPRQGIDPTIGEIDFAQVNKRRYFTCPGSHRVNVPCTVEQVRGKLELRVSTFPHMAGIVVVDPASLKIRSSNSVFCGALFGYEKPDGMPINALVPEFDKILDILTEEDGLQMLDGMVVPEHRFRRASAFLALREHRPDAGAFFLQPDGLPARHRDGSDLKVDGSDEDEAAETDDRFSFTRKEMVFALWITYSRHLHAHAHLDVDTAEDSGTDTPLHQPSPGQTPPLHTPQEIASDEEAPKKEKSLVPTTLSKQLKDAAISAAAKLTRHPKPTPKSVEKPPVTRAVEPARKTTIDDYTILEDMGQGAYGQVKLARHKTTGKKVVLKYVTKRRILVDTWTRDRKLGTVPLEIHVLDYLRRPEFRHPNIVEMEGFFEDDVNYYIEMAPHGLPGMDLFDYIELRANMDEAECRSIFVQVARAIHFLHTTALVVHRDIKDENVILDGEGNIKLIDFGSAAYIKSGPFDVFVGTIDYAAPEVLAGKPYGGKEQDVWALGILLYTIIYKENPFYSIDEIMDRDLRIPFTISDESIDLIRCMLNRDVKERYDIKQVLEHPWCKAADAST